MSSLAHYTKLAGKVFQWAMPGNPFGSHTDLRPFMKGVPRDKIGDGIDREFWAGEVLDEIRRDAEQHLTRVQMSTYDREVDEMRAAWDSQRGKKRPAIGNPASVMVGPGWSSARERLRSAAAKKKNPKRDFLEFARDLARYDNRHIAPVQEYMAEGMAKHAALEQLRRDLEDTREDWWNQHRDDLREEGVRTDAQISEAFREYRDTYLNEASASNPDRPKRNPARDLEPAIEKYKEFHRYEPKKLGEFGAGFQIPDKMVRAGAGRWVTYRSAKIDPATLRKPTRPVSYIHEHDAGVEVYWPTDDQDVLEVLEDHECDIKTVTVPSSFTGVDALVKLGDSLGYSAQLDSGDEIEMEEESPYPELYCTPDGKCLIVVDRKKYVLAMMWGGALGVFGRGIDG